MSRNNFAEAVRVALTFLEGLTPAQLARLAEGKAGLRLDTATPGGGSAAHADDLWSEVQRLNGNELRARIKAAGGKGYSRLSVGELRQLLVDLTGTGGVDSSGPSDSEGARTASSMAGIPDVGEVRSALMAAETREAASDYIHGLDLKKASLSKLAKALNIRVPSNASPDEIVAKIVATTTGGRIKAEVLQAL